MTIHTATVGKAKRAMRDNRILGDHPLPISSEESNLKRPQRTMLSELRLGHCRLLHSYKSRLDPAISPNCPDCGVNPQDEDQFGSRPGHSTELASLRFVDTLVKQMDNLSSIYP